MPLNGSNLRIMVRKLLLLLLVVISGRSGFYSKSTMADEWLADISLSTER